MGYQRRLSSLSNALNPRVDRISRILVSAALFLVLQQQVQAQVNDAFQSIAQCCDTICRTATSPQVCLELVPSTTCPQLSPTDDYCSCAWGVIDIPNNVTYSTPRCVVDIKEFVPADPVEGSTAFIVLLALSIFLCGCGCSLCWYCFVRVPEADTKEEAVANPEEAEPDVPETPSTPFQKFTKGLRKVGSFQEMKKKIKSTFSSDEEDNDDEERGERGKKKNVKISTKPESSGRRALEPPPPTQAAGVVHKPTDSAKEANANGNGSRKARPPALGQDTSGFGFRTDIYPSKEAKPKKEPTNAAKLSANAQLRRGSAPPTPTHLRDIQRATEAPAAKPKGKSLSPEDYMKRRFSLNPQTARQGPGSGNLRLPPGAYRASASDQALIARQLYWEEHWRRTQGFGGGVPGRGPPMPYAKPRSNSMMPIGHARPTLLDEGAGLMWPSQADPRRRGSHIPTVREVALQAQREVLLEQQQQQQQRQQHMQQQPRSALDKARRVANRVRRDSGITELPPAHRELGFPHAHPGFPEMPPHWPPGIDPGGARAWGGSQGRMGAMMYGAPQAPSSGPTLSDSRRSLGSQGPSSTGSSRSLGSVGHRGSNRSLRDLERAGGSNRSLRELEQGGSSRSLRGLERGSSRSLRDLERVPSRGLSDSGRQVIKNVDGVMMGFGEGGGVFHADKGAYDPSRDVLRFKLSEPGGDQLGGYNSSPLQFMTDSIMEGSAESRTNSRGVSPTNEDDDDDDDDDDVDEHEAAELERMRERRVQEGQLGTPEHEAQYKRISSAWEKGQAALSELRVEERLAAERRQGLMRHPGPAPEPPDLDASLRKHNKSLGMSPQVQRAPTPNQSGRNPEDESVGPRGGPVPVWKRTAGQRREPEPAYSVV